MTNMLSAAMNRENPVVSFSLILLFLSLEGIGILNIYARLKLLYKEDAIFKIGNLPEGGARIIIGGPLLQAGK